MELGRVGIWTGGLRGVDASAAIDAATELDELGYGAIFMPAGGGGEVFDLVASILDATPHIAIATGILNIWFADPVAAAAATDRLLSAHRNRFVLGLGVSHQSVVERSGELRYAQPLAVMERFLDGLDAADPRVHRSTRLLAALGPKMLALSRDRAGGAHPYLVSPDHTRLAREILGERKVLAPEMKVVLETDPAVAREVARAHLDFYLRAPNYANNLLRLGFTEDDLTNGGSDHLIDAVVAWGDLGAIKDRFDEHVAAGADHVCVQVLGAEQGTLPRAAWRSVAGALIT